jgi:SAM-dependent methyltransferase
MTQRDFIALNRTGWNQSSDDYQARHGGGLGDDPMAWGVWRLPEKAVDAIGPVVGKRILELGCGAAQWSAALAQGGAKPIGLDLSERQLAFARRHVSRRQVRVPLVQASAVCLPFRSCVFDVVFCDHGAMTFCPPDEAVEEASRVLKLDGLLVFCMSTPIRDICLSPGCNAVADRLHSDYFGLSVSVDDGLATYQLPYGDWIRLFRRCGFVVEDLIELQAPQEATTSYADYVPLEWARRWPAEHIWKVRKCN